ncbi:hypothetical protein [Rhizobium herbae]|jgi:hypothetical protein
MDNMLGKAVVILVVLTAVALAVPQLSILAAMTGIGIPIALGIWFAPALLLILFLFLLIKELFPSRLPGRTFVALALALVVLALPPLVLNIKIDSQAKTWIADDRNDLVLPLKVRVIAVRQAMDRYPKKGTIECDGFCMHALLTGTAEKVLLAQAEKAAAQPRQQETAIAFRFEKRGSCPAVNYGNVSQSLDLPRTDRDGSEVRAVDLINLKVSQGECLIRERTTLAEAQIVITRRDVKTSAPEIDDGFSLAADTVSASRMTVHARDISSIDFQEVYRKTEIRYRPFGYLMVPFVNSGSGFEMKPGWWRNTQRLNASGVYADGGKDWIKLLTETLGFKLTLESQGADESINNNIEAAIAARRAPTAAEWKAYSDYFDNAAIRSKLTKPEFDLQMKILSDPNFPPPPRLYSIVRFSTKAAPSALPTLASAIVKRSLAGKTWPDSVGVSQWQSLSNLSLGIKTLPADALKPYFAEMVQLSKNREARTAMYQGLTRLHVFGDAAVPAMLGLIEEGLSGGDFFSRDIAYQHPYLAGLEGLCLAGASASSALPYLRGWLVEKRLPVGALLVTTMTGLGAQPDQLWEMYSAANSKSTRKNFDRLVNASRSRWRDCQH